LPCHPQGQPNGHKTNQQQSSADPDDLVGQGGIRFHLGIMATSGVIAKNEI
jgi:hypothetical protein